MKIWLHKKVWPVLSRDQRSEKQLAKVPRRVKVSLRLAFKKSGCQREHSYSSKLTSLSRSVLTMRYPATPLPESCLSVPREVIHNQSFPQFKTMQYLSVLHKVIHNNEIICNETPIQNFPQAGDRGVADKQYMVDVNGNIVDVVREAVFTFYRCDLWCFLPNFQT